MVYRGMQQAIFQPISFYNASNNNNNNFYNPSGKSNYNGNDNHRNTSSNYNSAIGTGYVPGRTNNNNNNNNRQTPNHINSNNNNNNKNSNRHNNYNPPNTKPTNFNNNYPEIDDNDPEKEQKLAARERRKEALKKQDETDLVKKLNELSTSKGQTKNNKYFENDFANNRDANFESKPRPYVRAKYDPRNRKSGDSHQTGNSNNNKNSYNNSNNNANQYQNQNNKIHTTSTGWPGSNQGQQRSNNNYHGHNVNNVDRSKKDRTLDQHSRNQINTGYKPRQPENHVSSRPTGPSWNAIAGNK